MSMQNYTGWPTNVNRIILDSSSITTGENALRTDELESGTKRSMEKSSFIPDTYSVTMEFDWVTKGSDGKTEYQRFLNWYKYVHKYGSVAFEFPSIIYSPQTGLNYVDNANQYNTVEFYKITSSIQGSKSGSCVRVTMTWETVYFGTLEIAAESTAPSLAQNCKPTHVDVVFNNSIQITPVSSQFSIMVGSNAKTITGFFFNGTTARIFYDTISVGTVLNIQYSTSSGTTSSFTITCEAE